MSTNMQNFREYTSLELLWRDVQPNGHQLAWKGMDRWHKTLSMSIESFQCRPASAKTMAIMAINQDNGDTIELTTVGK